ncbi:MAG: imidazoleglycerol-phosphate dehydratase HisB [Balneolaceae bacterium]|nr:imidazoleglycerol-phosphate dehydratase HisB [Balneolaceae bacterium]
MNILIENNALSKDNDELLWDGALYGLKRLMQLGHQVSFDLESLSAKQQKLLKNEEISSAEFKDEPTITVVCENKVLSILQDDKKIDEAKNWIELSTLICFPTRKASLTRKTAETDIEIELNLDGSGKAEIDTGLSFFDHMLEQIAKHGLIDLKLTCDGDLEVDEHHTIEDVAIALGECITKALGNKIGIQRYSFVLPMDESQSKIALDLSGRPYLTFDATFSREKVGDFPTEMVKHFFYSLAMNAKATLQVEVSGENDHHKIEACFKGFARCLRASISRSERNLNILPSTKNLL